MPHTSSRSRTLGRPRDPSVDDAVLKAAAALFFEHGVDGASIEQIAKRSGVTRATIYRRWSDREMLLADALVQMRQPPEGGPDILRHMEPAALVEFLKEQQLNVLTNPQAPKFSARLIGALPDHPRLAAIFRDRFIDPWLRAASHALERAREAGGLVYPGKTELLLELLSGAVTRRLLMRPGPPDSRKERAWVDAMFRQLGVECR